MSQARIIDGTAVAAEIRRLVGERTAEVKQRTGRVPGLAVVLVGDDPASQVYVRSKGKRADECGMVSFQHTLPADTSLERIASLVGELNRDDRIHGILVQLPLPQRLDPARVIEEIDPAKDVDGLHPFNIGRIVSGGGEALIPCTPLGCLSLLKRNLPSLAGLRAIVLGRSNLVGKPMGQLLLRESATVTLAHSHTRDLAEECRRADIVIAAVGKPELIRGDWIKPGATVIDVGINRVPTPDGKSRLIGDVAFAEASSRAAAITPVPGGVGPMTVAMLMRNTLEAFCRQNGVAFDMPL